MPNRNRKSWCYCIRQFFHKTCWEYLNFNAYLPTLKVFPKLIASKEVDNRQSCQFFRFLSRSPVFTFTVFPLKRLTFSEKEFFSFFFNLKKWRHRIARMTTSMPTSSEMHRIKYGNKITYRKYALQKKKKKSLSNFNFSFSANREIPVSAIWFFRKFVEFCECIFFAEFCEIFIFCRILKNQYFEN